MKRVLALLTVLACLLAMPLPAYGLDPYYVGTPAEPSEAYKNSKYYDALCAVELTGDMAYDIVNVALSQVGYREGNSASELHGENKNGIYDYNEYSYWWKEEWINVGWCAAFVTWCARQAQIFSDVLPGTAEAKPSAFGLDLTPREQHEPCVGDLIFFDWGYDGISDHVGLVVTSNSDEVLVVHGNYSEFVTVTPFKRVFNQILGYGRPAYTSAYHEGVPINFFPAFNTHYIYQDGEYFRNLLQAELVGRGAEDIVSIAKTQFGYRAGTSTYDFSGAGSEAIGTYTEYERWLPNSQYAGDWGTSFVVWCARQARVSEDVIAGTVVPNPANLGLSMMTVDDAVAAGHPKVGDIAFFRWPFTEYNWDNCAIVSSADETSVTVIIGNIEDGVVEEQTYSLTDSRLKGFAAPAYGDTAPNFLYFDANGGVCNTSSRYAYEGEAYGALPTPERSGYIFDGWHFNGNAVTEDTTYPGGNLTLTAKWKLPTFTLTFNTLGNGDAPAPRTLEKGSAIGTLPALTRSGYDFKGWFTSAEGGDAVTEATLLQSDMTVYARFSVTVGNINGDGRIDSLDAAVLARYIAGWSGYEEQVVLAAADLDGDGRPATPIDAACLARHLAGWSGYEKFPLKTSD